MTIPEMLYKLNKMEELTDELHNDILADDELCNVEGGNLANYMLNELEMIKGHINNLR